MDISAIRVAVLVHDLRNILSVINGSADRIHLHLPPGVAQQEVPGFRSAVARAAVLTGEFLVGRPPDLSSPRQVDLNRVIAPAVEVFERLCGDRIRVRVDLSDEPALESTRLSWISSASLSTCSWMPVMRCPKEVF